MFFLRCKVIFLAHFLLSDALCAQDAKEQPNSTFTLDNGLRVFVLTNTRVPVVYHSVWYNVGSTDDPAGKSGMAHYLEHMMFKSSKNYPSGEYVKIVERCGAKYNATTSYDRTNYYQTVDKKHLETMMKLEADRMVNLTMDEKEALSERKVVIEERLMTRDNPPQGRLSEMVIGHYYLHHPYRFPVIGWKHEMETYTYQDALSFYKKFYSPSNAIIVLSGDITVEEAKTLTQKYYGSIPATKIEDKKRLQEPDNHQITAQVELKDKDFGTPSFSFVFKGVSWKDDIGKTYALDVVASLLSGKTGLWYDTLIEKEKIATNVNVDYHGFVFDTAAPFEIEISLPKGANVELAKKRMLLLIEDLIKNDLTDDDVKLAKIKATNVFDYIKDSATSYGNFVGGLLIKGFTLDQIESMRDNINKVTKEDMKKVIKEVFGVPARVISTALPQE